MKIGRSTRYDTADLDGYIETKRLGTACEGPEAVDVVSQLLLERRTLTEPKS